VPVPGDAAEQEVDQEAERGAELRKVAELAALEAAALVRERRAGGASVADHKSSRVDIVTEVDRESEAFLRRRLAQLRPGDGFLGEEGGRSGSTTGVTWVVDPIDGTVNFLYGIPHYCVSVAAVDADERSLAGAVVDVTRGSVFSAVRGGGATQDGVPIRVRDPGPLSEQLFLTGFQYQRELRELQGAAVARLVPRVRDIRRMGSAALELCALGAGTVDAYVEEGLHLWDRAAAALVATEAGARVEVHRGAGGMDCVIGAPRGTFDEVLQLVTECGFLATPELGGEGFVPVA
jgi:myo-inositol-1(or 4)-monophosphatase